MGSWGDHGGQGNGAPGSLCTHSLRPELQYYAYLSTCPSWQCLLQGSNGVNRAGGLGRSPFLRHTAWLGVTGLSLLLGGIPPWLQVAEPHLQDLGEHTLKSCGCRRLQLAFRSHFDALDLALTTIHKIICAPAEGPVPCWALDSFLAFSVDAGE